MTCMPVASLVDLVRVRAETLGERCAYTFLQDGEHEAAQLSYAELDRRARAIAARIEARVQPGAAVLLAYPPGLDFIAAFFGCLYAGAVAVPVAAPHPRRGGERLLAIAGDCGARVALTTNAGADALAQSAHAHPALARIEALATGSLDAAADHRLPERADVQAPAFLQYTSGSTQGPRGVRVSHANVISNLAAIHAAEGNSARSRGLTWLPTYHDMGLIEGILEPLFGGYPAWLMPHAAFLQRPARWLRAIARYAITVSGGPNFAYDLCVRRIAPDEMRGLELGSWEVAYCGAEPVRARTMREFADRFAPCGFRRRALRPVYGLAEATLLVSASPRDAQGVQVVHACKGSLDRGRYEPSAAGAPDAVTLVACGQPIAGTRLAIVDPERKRTVQPGTVGEIWVSGPGVAEGYRRADPAAGSAFVSASIDGTIGRWLRTGDLGFLADEALVVSGRIKDLIIVRGRKLHPHDLEQTAERSDARIMPAGAAAFALEGAASEQVVLCVELSRALARNGVAADPALSALADTIRECVYREHAVAIATVAFVPAGALARTSSGKLMRFRCRRDFCAGVMHVLRRFDNEPAPASGALS